MSLPGRGLSTSLEPEAPAQGIDELLERESRIERAQRNAYYEIGLELRAIRDKRLYKVKREEAVTGRYSFETFEDYCKVRWEWERQHAYRLIDAASAAEKLSPIGVILPARESHIRPLIRLDIRLESDGDRATAWQAVIAKHGTSIAAKDVEALAMSTKSRRSSSL